jgi:hypothetical protein
MKTILRNNWKTLVAFASLLIIAIVMAQISIEGVISAMAIVAYTKACEKNVGGNSAVYVTEAANVSSITVVSGEITAVTMVTGKTFQQIQADLDSIVRTEEGAGTRNNIAYTHKVEMVFSKPSKELNTLRDSLAAASACGILVIVTDGNGESWLVGYNETDLMNRPLYLLTDSGNSGKEPTEEGGQAVSVILQGTNGYLCLPFDATNAGTIKGGTAAFITYA